MEVEALCRDLVEPLHTFLVCHGLAVVGEFVDFPLHGRKQRIAVQPGRQGKRMGHLSGDGGICRSRHVRNQPGRERRGNARVSRRPSDCLRWPEVDHPAEVGTAGCGERFDLCAGRCSDLVRRIGPAAELMRIGVELAELLGDRIRGRLFAKLPADLLVPLRYRERAGRPLAHRMETSRLPANFSVPEG